MLVLASFSRVSRGGGAGMMEEGCELADLRQLT